MYPTTIKRLNFKIKGDKRFLGGRVVKYMWYLRRGVIGLLWTTRFSSWFDLFLMFLRDDFDIKSHALSAPRTKISWQSFKFSPFGFICCLFRWITWMSYTAHTWVFVTPNGWAMLRTVTTIIAVAKNIVLHFFIKKMLNNSWLLFGRYLYSWKTIVGNVQDQRHQYKDRHRNEKNSFWPFPQSIPDFSPLCYRRATEGSWNRRNICYGFASPPNACSQRRHKMSKVYVRFYAAVDAFNNRVEYSVETEDGLRKRRRTNDRTPEVWRDLRLGLCAGSIFPERRATSAAWSAACGSRSWGSCAS